MTLRFEPPSAWALLVQHDAIEAQIFDDAELKKPGMQPVFLLALGMARVCRDWHDRKLLGGNYWDWLFRYLYDRGSDDRDAIRWFQWQLRYDVPRYVSGITQIGGRCEAPARTTDGRCNSPSTCGPHIERRLDGTKVGHHFCARHRHLGKAIEAANPVQSTGAAAGQTVPHLHFHLVPRWTGDHLGDLWEKGREWWKDLSGSPGGDPRSAMADALRYPRP